MSALEDELAIGRTLASYCHLVDDGDFSGLSQQFSPDGTFAFGGRVATGRHALVRWFEENHPPERRGKHATTNVIVDLEGDRARAVSDFVFLRWIDGAIRPDRAGRYVDALVRTDGRWLIDRRDVELLASPPGSPSGRRLRSGEDADVVPNVTGRGPNDELLVEARGPVRLVTLNRPDALNAANEALHGEIARIWGELDADAEVRAIVLTGSGASFSGGGDLHLLGRMVHDTALRQATMAEGAEIVRAMTSVRAPIIAAVNGPAVGLGCSLASLSDLVVMEEQAYFADPHVALGLVAADGGALTWPLLTSLLRAKEFILLGDRLGAADALQLGLANRVVPTGTAVDVAFGLAERMAALPLQAVQETKALLNDALCRSVASLLAGAIAAESASFDQPASQANLARLLRGTTSD